MSGFNYDVSRELSSNYGCGKLTACHRLKLSNPTTFTRQITVLRNLLRQLLPQPSSTGIVSPSPLISVLLGLSSPSPPPTNDEPLVFLDERLNDSQREAVKFVLRDTAEVGLIWGPPGQSTYASLSPPTDTNPQVPERHKRSSKLSDNSSLKINGF